MPRTRISLARSVLSCAFPSNLYLIYTCEAHALTARELQLCSKYIDT